MGSLIQQPSSTERTTIWPTVGVGVLIVVIVVAIIAFVSRAERKVPTPAPPYASHLKFGDLKLSAAQNFVGATVTYLDGEISNTGDKTVTHVMVEATFKNSLGEVVQQETQPVRVLKTTGPYPDAVDLTVSGLAPKKVLPFRLTLEHISTDWNQQYPDLKIVEVTTK